MADDTKTQPTPAPVQEVVAVVPPPVPPVAEDLDETQPGGRYIVGGLAVNAEGEPVKDKKGK